MSKPCVKCDEGTAIILVGTNGSFCKECFEKYFAHKFRASLGKHPIVRYDDRVAVAFSGGINSSAMLYVLLESLSPFMHKRLKFHPGIIFIDETFLFPEDGKDYKSSLEEIETVMKASGLPYHVVKFDEIMYISDDDDVNNLNKNNDETKQSDKLKKIFESMKSITSKEELLYRLRCKLLAFKAKELGYQHVFLGETSSRLAINILSNIALGQGAHLSLDTGFTDHGRYFGINLLRPLRDISSKEIAVYSNIHKIPNVFLPNFSTKEPATSSIQRLTEDFIVSLSADFPSTETTVYRTSNKLEMMKNSKSKRNDGFTNSHNFCTLCCGALDTHIKEGVASALQAIELTENLCSGEFGSAEHQCLPDQFTHTRSLDLPNSNFKVKKDKEVESRTTFSLCHSCKILHNDVNTDNVTNIATFEQSILKSNHTLVSTKEIRKQLDDVLIGS